MRHSAADEQSKWATYAINLEERVCVGQLWTALTLSINSHYLLRDAVEVVK